MRRLVSALLVLAALGAVRARAAEDESGDKHPPGVLTFTNGDWLPGRLAPSSRAGEISWQANGFREPFRFDAKMLYLKEVRFEVPLAAAWKAESHCLVLVNGDVLYGSLESLGSEDLVFRSTQAGRVRLKRSEVRCLECYGEHAAILYSGPNSAAEWTRLPQDDAWRESEGGLATYLTNSTLRLDLDLPPQVMVEFEVSWKVRADFELLLGIGKDEGAAWPACRLECVEGALVVRRETEQDLDLQKILDLKPGEGRLRLRILLDQERQRVEVMSDDGLPLASAKTEKDAPQTLPGICLKHRSGRLRLDQLRVSRWSGAAPADAVVDAPRIQCTDGAVLYGDIIRYDAKRREFHLAGTKQEQVCSADRADRVFLTRFSEQPVRDENKAANQVICADGTRLSGWVDKVDGERLRLECREAVNADTLEAVSVPVGEIRGIRFLKRLAPPTRTVGDLLVLELDDGQIHGALASAGGEPPQPGLGWKPLGSENSSALKDDVSGRIDFPASTLPAKLRLDEGETDKLYLRAGDVVRCRIESIDSAGVVCRLGDVPSKKLSHGIVKAVELGVQPSQEPLPQDKQDRLLTLPRLQKDDPPTHILGSVNGDFLRGRLREVSGDKVRFEVNSHEREFDRRLVSRIIWLHPEKPPGEDEDSPQPALPKGSVQVVRIDGTRMTFVPQAVDGGWVSGVNELMGPCRVHVDQESELLIGDRVLERAAQLAYGAWKLAGAAEPLVSKADSAGDDAPQDGVGSPLIGRPAPDFEVEMLAGKSFRLSARQGKVVVLDFWASWCAPCMQGLPMAAEAMAEFPADQVEFAAVNLQQTPDEARAALRRLELSIPVALDRDGGVARQYGATAIPYTVVIGRDGAVAHVFVGSGPRLKESLKAAVQSLLPPPAQTEPDSTEAEPTGE